MKLTIKQKKFADEYIISGNATESYKRAGYAWKTEGGANSNASALLRNHKVAEYIQTRMKELEDKAIARQEEVLKYLTSVLRGETESEIVVIEGEGDGFSAARKVKKAPDEKDRLKAAELLGKRYGLYTDKVDMTQALTIVFEDDYGDSEDY